MAKFCSGFSLMHFFVLSLALNLAFISKVVYEGESSRQPPFMADIPRKEGQVSKASTTSNNSTEGLDDGLRVLYFGQHRLTHQQSDVGVWAPFHGMGPIYSLCETEFPK